MLDTVTAQIDQTRHAGRGTDIGVTDRQCADGQINTRKARLHREHGDTLRRMSVITDIPVIDDERSTRPVGIGLNDRRLIIRRNVVGFALVRTDGQIPGIGDGMCGADGLGIVGHAVTDRTEVGIAHLGCVLWEGSGIIRLFDRIGFLGHSGVSRCPRRIPRAVRCAGVQCKQHGNAECAEKKAFEQVHVVFLLLI